MKEFQVMKTVTKFLLAGAGIASMAAAAPASAQYYPPAGGYGGGYGGQYGYGNQGGVIGSILNQILGGRSYGTNERQAVEQCVRAVEYRINTRGLDNEGGRYRQYGYGYGYNNGYNNNYAGARVVSVNQVSRRSNGGLRVDGYATTGNPIQQRGYGNNGYGYDNYGYGQYGYQAQADARFNCTIDRYGRITDIDAKRNTAGYYPGRRY
jgi:hypothetical protein